MKQRLDYNLNWNEHFQVDAESSSGLVRIKIESVKTPRNILSDQSSFRRMENLTVGA